MSHSLDILADLLLTVDGADVPIRGTGDRIVIDLPNLRTGRRMLAAGPFAAGQRAEGIARANDLLAEAGLTLDVRLDGSVLARLGATARPNAVGRLLNLGAAEVRPVQPVWAAARRRPGLVLGLVAGTAVVGGLLWYWRSRD